ncbi:MAG: DUF2190 family protein, partial [Betaproteobacteria bacterium]|nr:DUF2190 family protein [Betaproteobacteria bacterium]
MSQFEKLHATTRVLTVDVAANRFIAYNGGYAATTGGVKDAIGVSETAGRAGEAIAVVTGWSYIVEADEAIALHAFVQPGAEGHAVTGDADEHCGRALQAATAAGDLIEVQ